MGISKDKIEVDPTPSAQAVWVDPEPPFQGLYLNKPSQLRLRGRLVLQTAILTATSGQASDDKSGATIVSSLDHLGVNLLRSAIAVKLIYDVDQQSGADQCRTFASSSP